MFSKVLVTAVNGRKYVPGVGAKVSVTAVAVKDKAEEAKKNAKEKLVMTAAAVKDRAKEKAEAAKDRALVVKEEGAAKLDAKARETAAHIIDMGLGRATVQLGNMVKENTTSDPDMPRSVKRALEAMVDNVMPEVRDILDEALTNKLRKEVVDERIMGATSARCCDPHPVGCLRAFVLYKMFPHDKTIFAQMHDPWWWIFLAAACFPAYEIGTAWWVLLFLLHDKRDEYRLVDFIITFKASQFVVGLLQGAATGWKLLFADCLIGVTQDLKNAASVYENATGSGDALDVSSYIEHGCNEPFQADDPAEQALFQYELAVALMKGLLCWGTVVFLPWARQKGGRLYHPIAGLPSNRIHGRGGRVVWAVMIDACIWSACIVWGACNLWFTSPAGTPRWLVHARLSYIKALYGMLCFPWLLFKLPLAYNLILALKPTGYNQHGDTVRLATAKEIKTARDIRGNPNCCGALWAPCCGRIV